MPYDVGKTVAGILSPELITRGVVWAFLAFVAIYTIFSAILLYHWRRFSMRAHAFGVAEMVYLTGSVVLFAGAIMTLLATMV